MRDLAEKTEKWQSDTMLANARKVCLKTTPESVRNQCASF